MFAMQNFTNEDLVLYIYNELKGIRKKDFEKELPANWALQEKLQIFSEAQQRLSKLRLFSPRKQSLKAILQYANAVSEVS
jgi:hypothetical protein